MPRRTVREPDTSPEPALPVRRRPIRTAAAVLAVGVVIALLLIAPPGPHGWRDLPPGFGRIRWVESRTDASVQPPLAPGWVRTLRGWGLPWPTDLPTQPVGASFGLGGGSEQTVAWYLVQSATEANELWHLEKNSVRLADVEGKEVLWPGGTGAALADGPQRLQFLYLGVPRELAGKGGTVRFRLSRFGGSSTEEVELPF